MSLRITRSCGSRQSLLGVTAAYEQKKRRGLLSRRITLGAMTMSVLVTASALSVEAQTRFAWPIDTGDVTRYSTVEECLSATVRIRKSVEGWATVWADTLPLTPERAKASLIAAIVETARRCSARLPTAEKEPVTDFAPLMQLYLLAGRDADAETIMRRRLASVAPTALRERVAVLDTAVQGYLSATFGSVLRSQSKMLANPVRLPAAESLLVEVGRLPDTLHSVKDRLLPVFEFLRAAKVAEDTARVQWASQRYLDLDARLNSIDRRSEFYAAIGAPLAYLALATQQEAALLDSLRRSTVAFVTFQRGAWAHASGELPQALRFPIGEQAPAIVGDFWFHRGDSSATRPAKGKVSLVVFLDTKCHMATDCWGPYASMHRLAQRFPAVDITVAVRTHGYFSQIASPAPAGEADLLREWWQGFHQVPGALAVTATDFWRLDPPDRRRIDRPTPNETHYSFGRTWQTVPGMAFLVDQGGTIVGVGMLGMHDVVAVPDMEELFARMIEVLQSRTS
jgi:hypothetical protein